MTIKGFGFGEALFSIGIENAESEGYLVSFINEEEDGEPEIVDGEIIDHFHNDETMVVKTPPMLKSGIYEIKIFKMVADENGYLVWELIEGNFDRCFVTPAVDRTPMVRTVYPANSMNPNTEAFWTDWDSIENSDNEDDEELFITHYQKNLLDNNLANFCKTTYHICFKY